MSAPPEFNGRPFVAGSITGVRSFAVDSLGRLTGVSQRDVWRPGINKATCAITPSVTALATAADVSAYMAHYLSSAYGGFSSPFGSVRRRPTPPSEKVSLIKTPKHRVGQLNCSCGFWAYFDRGSNPHHSHGNILGVVEGHGTVTVGSRGFRASDAKIVGLVRPKRPCEGRPFDSLASRARRLDNLGAPVAGVSLVSGTAGFVVAAASFSTGLWALGAVAALLSVLCLFTCYLMFRAIDVSDVIARDKPAGFDAVRRNYPDVPVYRSLRAALAKHPLTPPPPPEPPSPDRDPDFWTRSAS